VPGPLFFVDRSLGRVRVPALLRESGWALVTLSEYYGVPQDEPSTMSHGCGSQVSGAGRCS
jgi:hypothetical protein